MSQPSQVWQFETNCWMKSLWGIWLVRILFCVWRGALLKPDLGTSASRFAIAMSTKPDLGRPPSQQSDEDEEEPWTVKTNGCWLGMTERITCPSLCFCCLISIYWFTLHCKWTSKGKRAKTNEANEGMTLREEPQWLAEPPFRYCRLWIIGISNSENTFSFCLFSFGYIFQKGNSVDECGCFF